MRGLTLQGFLHRMVERGITRNNFGKCFAPAVIVFDYENFCAHTKAQCGSRKVSLCENGGVIQERRRAAPEFAAKVQVPYVACASRFRTKVSQLVNARDDEHKRQTAKMAQPMISRSFKVHDHPHQYARIAFYEP